MGLCKLRLRTIFSIEHALRVVLCTVRFQSRKTYCAAFCASLDLLAGSGTNIGYNGGKYLGVMMGYARTSFTWFIFSWANMKFCGISLLRKSVSPCLLRGSLAYIFSGLLINMQYLKSQGCLWIVIFAAIFLVYHGKIQGSKTAFNLVWKNMIPHEKNTPVSISEIKMLLLTKKI